MRGCEQNAEDQDAEELYWMDKWSASFSVFFWNNFECWVFEGVWTVAVAVQWTQAHTSPYHTARMVARVEGAKKNKKKDRVIDDINNLVSPHNLLNQQKGQFTNFAITLKWQRSSQEYITVSNVQVDSFKCLKNSIRSLAQLSTSRTVCIKIGLLLHGLQFICDQVNVQKETMTPQTPCQDATKRCVARTCF